MKEITDPAAIALPYSSPLYYFLCELVLNTSTAESLAAGFRSAAKMMLKEYALYVNGLAYQLIDIEFYFYNAEIHPDPYSHSAQYPGAVTERQSATGRWYFHRYTQAARYTHTRRGVDVTYGDAKKKRFGGILIRGLKTLKENRFIIGPSNVVGEIKKQLASEDSLNLCATAPDPGFAFNPKSPLSLQPITPPFKEALYTAIRYGLGDKDLLYKQKKYRFFTYPEKVKKTKPFLYKEIE